MGVSLPIRGAVCSGVLWQVLDVECVLLDLQTNHCVSLDENGSRTWQLLDRHADVETVIGLLLAEQDVNALTLCQDLAELINTLADAELVTVS
jgi:hypothetical protein